MVSSNGESVVLGFWAHICAFFGVFVVLELYPGSFVRVEYLHSLASSDNSTVHVFLYCTAYELRGCALDSCKCESKNVRPDMMSDLSTWIVAYAHFVRTLAMILLYIVRLVPMQRIASSIALACGSFG